VHEALGTRNEVHEVIDGQQRIVTAARHLAHERRHPATLSKPSLPAA